METNTSGADFFVAGGTLSPNVPSYVKRPADDELFKHIIAGDFCYVLTPRQMGKSSLMIRTAHRLRAEGIKTAIVDLTQSGTTGVTADQWYLALVRRLTVELELKVDLRHWWQENAASDPVSRFTNFLREVVLAEIEQKVVIFIDEIDTTLGLDFSTDDFFAAIRSSYNARADDPVYNRLTFVLLGVATPGDLIKDRRRTPFNIGQAIPLQEFSRSDAQVLQDKLHQIHPEQGLVIFDRIFYWTGGHPYLTQKLCLTAANDETSQWSEIGVNTLVEDLFLSAEAAKMETNLRSVQDHINVSAEKRDLLQLYRRVYIGKPPIKCLSE